MQDSQKQASPSIEDVAEWMAAELKEKRELIQADAVHEIYKRFGETFINSDRGECISPKVLRAFRKLTPDAGYSKSEKLWRYKEPSDGAGRRLD